MVLVERYCPKCGAANLEEALVCVACGVSSKATQPLGGESMMEMLSSLLLNQHLQASQLFREKYRIVRRVGVGGFGAVYEAEDEQTGRQVAIKEIGLTGLSPQQIIEATGSFNREVELLLSLKHQSIPRMYEQLTDAEHWYLVMDFIVGETLENLLAQAPGRRLPLEEALRIGIQLCSVLDYLHTYEPVVVFRDIKPANVMITPEQKLYLIDFGVARQYKPGKMKDTIAFGSPGYASPEQYGRAQTTPRADLYSLGALLHEMLSGLDPSLNPFRFPLLRDCDRTLPVDLEQLVKQLLEMEVEHRPASADMVRRRLQSLEAGVRTTNKRRQKLVASRPVVRQSQVPLASADALARTFSTVGVTVSIYRGHSEPVRALSWSRDGHFLATAGERLHIWNAFQPLSTSPHVLSVPGAHVKLIQDLEWSPDGRFLATASLNHSMVLWNISGSMNWWRSLAIYFAFHRHEFQHRSHVNALSWSPDGYMIAVAEEDGRIHVWDARLHEELLVYQGHTDGVEDIAWSPDGLRIASTGLDHTVRVRDSVDGQSLWRWYANKHTVVYTVAWSPDGRYLACGANDGRVHIWDILQERQAYIYTRHKQAVNAVAWSPDGQRIASASSDHTVQVWGALDGKGAFSYRSHEYQVLAVAWAPDGQHLASAGVDTTVHIWKTV